MKAQSNLLDYKFKFVEQASEHILQFCNRLCDMCENPILITDELEDKFYGAVSDIVSLQLGSVPAQKGSFVVENGTVTFDLNTVLQLIDIVYADIQAEIERTGNYLDQHVIVDLALDVFLVYFLHEIRHRRQGIEHYSDVQQMKEAGGGFILGQLDLLADRDAIFAYSTVMSGGNDPQLYLQKFVEAIFFNINYFFNMFDFSSAKPHKTDRAASLILMAGRFARSIDDKMQYVDEEIALDSPLYVCWKPGIGMPIFNLEPHLSLIGTSVSNDNEELYKHLRCGDFYDALKSGVRIISAIGL